MADSTARKIQSEDEIKRWNEEGRTFRWMAEEYLRKYNIEISPSTIGSLVSRRGWKAKQVRDPRYMPWRLWPEHKWLLEPMILRALARQRQGLPVPERKEREITNLLATLEQNGTVLHYVPELDPPFIEVPREPQDGDYPVRQPDRPELMSDKVQDRS